MYYTPKVDKATGMIGEGVRFERIRKTSGFPVRPWTKLGGEK